MLSIRLNGTMKKKLTSIRSSAFLGPVDFDPVGFDLMGFGSVDPPRSGSGCCCCCFGGGGSICEGDVGMGWGVYCMIIISHRTFPWKIRADFPAEERQRRLCRYTQQC